MCQDGDTAAWGHLCSGTQGAMAGGAQGQAGTTSLSDVP